MSSAEKKFQHLTENKLRKMLLILYNIREELSETNPDIVKKLLAIDKEILKETNLKFSDKDKRKVSDLIKEWN